MEKRGILVIGLFLLALAGCGSDIVSDEPFQDMYSCPSGDPRCIIPEVVATVTDVTNRTTPVCNCSPYPVYKTKSDPLQGLLSPPPSLEYDVRLKGKTVNIDFEERVFLIHPGTMERISINDPAHILCSSDSMNPTFNCTSTLIFYKPDSYRDVYVGDIVLFKKDETTNVIHRVVTVKPYPGGYHYITKGDANRVEDDEITGEQILGKVVGVIY